MIDIMLCWCAMTDNMLCWCAMTDVISNDGFIIKFN